MAIQQHQYDVATSRNIGIRNVDQQRKLQQATVLVAGTGGAGGFNAEALVREGVGGIVLAEPDIFETSNLNRQNGSGYSTLGMSKSSVIAERLLDINPHLRMKSFCYGVTHENIEELLDGVALVYDAIDISRPDLSVALAQAARRRGIPVMLGVDIAYGGNVFAFHPDGMTLEELTGLPQDLDPQKFDWSEAPLLPFIQRIPPYIDLEVLKKVLDGSLGYTPAIATSVFTITAVMCGRAVMYLGGEKDLIYSPCYLHVDIRTCKMKIRKVRPWSRIEEHKMQLAFVAETLKSKFKR